MRARTGVRSRMRRTPPRPRRAAARASRRDRCCAVRSPIRGATGPFAAVVIDEILPRGVVSAQTFVDTSEGELFAEELALIARAAPTRRAEFTTGRACARRALAELGVEAAAILSGEQREPLWPDGIVGSITHCAGFRAAAVAHATEYRSIGIDAEPDYPLPDGILEMISLPAERGQLERSAGVHLDRVLFSAKEAVFKTWFPLARRWLGFEEATIALGPHGTFDVRVLVPGPIDGMQGRWLARHGLVLTAIVAPHVRRRAV